MRLGYHWGDTEAECEAHYPCDDLIAEPHQAAFRAVDVGAPAPLAWRWLCQLRAAPYSYDWIDNWGRRSPRELTPGLDELEIGQRAMAIFKIAGFERDRSLTVHAPRSIFGNVAVSYVVTPVDADHSRLTAKVIVRYPRGARWVRHVPPIGDLVMMRKQLRTLRTLAERDHRRTDVGRGGELGRTDGDGHHARTP